MDYHVLVADVFKLVSRNFTNHNNWSNFGVKLFVEYVLLYSNSDKHVIKYKDKLIYILPNNKYPDSDYLMEQFESFSLIDLRNILLLLIPFATNFNGVGSVSVFNGIGSVSVNTLDHVKLALKYITKEIESSPSSLSLCDDNSTLH